MEQIAYFDNAATTFPKPECVYTFADDFYRSNGANIGRSGHSLAQSASLMEQECKTKLINLLECPNKQAIFTSSATEALNRILLGLATSANTSIYFSPFEHNAITRVAHHLKNTKGCKLTLLPFDPITLEFNSEVCEELFCNNRPDILVITHASNVCGAIFPIKEITSLAKKFGAITIVDMSQSAGIVPCNISSDNIDFAVFAGHKSLLGPFGIGGFICKQNENRLSPILFGGNGINSEAQDMPSELEQMEEIGSKNVYAIAGLHAAITFIGESLAPLRQAEQQNSQSLHELLESYANIHIVAGKMQQASTGTVSVLFEGYSPDEIGQVLNSQGVFVRTGLHCAPFAHKFLGTLPSGTVRFSSSPLTSPEAYEHLKAALDYIEINS